MPSSADLRVRVLEGLQGDGGLEDVLRLEATARRAVALACTPAERVSCCICAAQVAARVVKSVAATAVAQLYLEDGLFLLAEAVLALESLEPRHALDQVLVCGMDLWSEARKLLSLAECEHMLQTDEFRSRMVSAFGGLPEAAFTPSAKELCAQDEHLLRIKGLMVELGNPDFNTEELIALAKRLPGYFLGDSSPPAAR